LAALCLAAGLPRAVRAQPLEALWYTRNGAPSTPAFLAHADRISIVSPQVFAFDSMGAIHGALDAQVVAAARAQRVQLVPLVMNPGFDQALMHRLLTVDAPRRRAIRSLAALCRDLPIDGIQFDVENVHIADKDRFTAFVREAVDSIHRAGCTVSAAVVPRTSDEPGPTPYHKWIYDNWRGVYDYKALADTLDFLSYMTYAQHTGGSPPGPVGGYPWIKASLEYVLSLGVPPHKISLGLPGYSDHWFPTWSAQGGARMTGSDIGYADGLRLLAQHKSTAVWDRVQKDAVRHVGERGRLRASVARGRPRICGKARIGDHVQIARLFSVVAGSRGSESVAAQTSGRQTRCAIDAAELVLLFSVS
jgi:spore germination protein YaaH